MRVFFLLLFTWLGDITLKTTGRSMLSEALNLKASHVYHGPEPNPDFELDRSTRSRMNSKLQRKMRSSSETTGETDEPRQKRTLQRRATAPKERAGLAAVLNGVPVQLSPVVLGPDGTATLDLSGLSTDSESSDSSSENLSGELVAADSSGNVAASLAELQLPGKGAAGPVYELVGAGLKLQPHKHRPAPPTPPPSPSPAAGNLSAVGEVMVNIQQDDKKRHGVKAPRHWCDLAGVWINDEGSLLLTLGFPAADKTVLSGYLSQVSVDMTPQDRRRRRRRRREADDSTAAPPTRPPPRYRPPPVGASGLPSSLTNRTALQGSAVTRAGPFALATKHSGGAVGSLVGQCQTCGGLDTIVAHVFAVSEVFTCLDAMWNQKAVRVMFRKWGERHRRRHRPPLTLDTEVVIKQRDRAQHRPPPPPPPPPRETMELTEEVVSKYSRR